MRADAIPEDFDQVLSGTGLSGDHLPKKRSLLLALARSQTRRVLPFWSPSGTWTSRTHDGVEPERIVAFGYRAASDFLVVMNAVLSRYGVPATELCLVLGDRKNEHPSEHLGEGAKRLNVVLHKGLSLVLAFQIREKLLAIDGIPDGAVASADRVLVEIVKGAVTRSHVADDEIDTLLWRFIATMGLAQLSRQHETRIKQVSLVLPGPFSHLRLVEFVELARRTAAVQARSGAKNIETMYEDQLALLAQSFGFQVVRAKRATRRVDLLCLVEDRVHPYTALIEAKSSGRPYSFPTDDQRALAEYVDDVRSSLGTLPPVALVLIVGSKAASTLEAKLRDVEAKLGIPLRFIDAATLARLRDRLPGPVPPAPFREGLVRSENPVLSAAFVDTVVEAFETSHSAHVSFVQALMRD
ncbi:MAG TPA: hypothetical protein VGN13_09360 [Solirubrobacteraceae bacterium]